MNENNHTDSCTVLITGFEPFGEDTINPSYEAVRLMPEEICGVTIIKERLPVVFGEAADQLQSMINRYHPDIVICTGLAGGRKGITPELLGRNRMEARIPDNRGNQPQGAAIEKDGREDRISTLPVHTMVDRLWDAGIPAEVSHSAGTFVCNEVLYRLLGMTSGSDIMAGFIHVPCIPGMQDEQPTMELQEIARALEICVETAVRVRRGEVIITERVPEEDFTTL